MGVKYLPFQEADTGSRRHQIALLQLSYVCANRFAGRRMRTPSDRACEENSDVRPSVLCNAPGALALEFSSWDAVSFFLRDL